MDKKSYFQGTEEPHTYKKEKAIRIQPRFETPLFHNYDYVGNSDTGPGSGYSGLQDYKSVSDFLKARRKKMKDKYKASDSYIPEEAAKKSKARILLLSRITKFAIDFPRDEQVTPMLAGYSTSYLMPQEIGSTPGSRENAEFPGEVGPGEIESYPNSVPFGNFSYNPLPDEDNKQESALDFANDLVAEEYPYDIIDEKTLKLLMNKYLNAAESEGVFGLPDGIVPNSALDGSETIDIENPDYGTTNSGNDTYSNTWI
jgi:hypothetical protein